MTTITNTITVEINNVDCSSYLLKDSLYIRSAIGNKGDTASFILQDESGNQFNSDLKGAMGTDVAKQEIWDNFEKNYKGKYVTVDFMSYTAAGIPRQPKARNLRKGPSQD